MIVTNIMDYKYLIMAMHFYKKKLRYGKIKIQWLQASLSIVIKLDII